VKTTRSLSLSVAATALLALPTLAQVLEPPPLTSIPDSQFCALVTDDIVTCQGVLTELGESNILPASFAAVAETLAASAAADAVAEATQEPAGLGDPQARGDVEITLVRADWDPDLSDSFYKPAKGKKYVSVRARYEALEDGATYNIIFWDALDKDGNRYEATVLGPVEPDLTVGDLAAGDSVEGWVTFEVPRAVSRLEIIESQVLEDDLVWSIKR
jgi:hypothetical protein